MKPLTLPIIVCSLGFAGPVTAADLTAPNASFTWTDANAWNGGSATWNSDPADNAIFGDITSGRTVNLTSAITAGDITFSNAANTWAVSGSGGQITLNGTLSKSGAGTASLSSGTLLAGDGEVLIDVGELQLLNNGNTFSGGVTLNSGTLRVGNNNGSGTPQTAGSLGTGTFTINGGTIFQNQGNVRTQSVSAVIGGNFSFNSQAGGGLVIGSNNGTRTVSLGSASRTITVSQNSDGTGANSFFGLRDLASDPGGAIVKEGEGVLRVQGTSTAPVTANAGTIEISAALGSTNFTMNSGTVWRKTTATGLADGSAITLNNASLVNKDTLENLRTSAFQTFLVTGTADVFVGSGLTIQSTGAVISGFNVRSGGVLGGNGSIRTATTDTPSAGTTTLSEFSDAVISIRDTGFISPGTPDALDSSIATLSFGSLVWQGSASTAPLRFNLGSGNQSDRIALSGNLGRDGSTLVHQFDFLGTGELGQTYTLITFDTVDVAIEESMFIATNLASGITGTFALNANSLTFTTDGEGGGTPFEEWAGGAPYNLAGDDALPGSDPDKDGVENLIEFALNGNPTSGSDNGKQFVKMAVVDSVPNVLTLTIAVRSGASFAASGNRQSATVDQITYTVEASNNLADWGTPVVTEVTGADATTIQSGLPAPDTGWTYHTFRSDGSAPGDSADFMRLKVEETP